MPDRMANQCIIVTAADSAFFELAQGCIQSIRAQANGTQVTLAFLDLGCTNEQIAALRSQVDHIRRPDWEYSFPGRERVPSYLRGLLARPFLRRYFPGNDVYLWIDADAWVQDWRAVELLQNGACRGPGLAIIPEVDRGSMTQYGGLPRYWDQAYIWYEQGHGREIASKLHSFPMLNAGVFALHRDAPHWRIWEHELSNALNRSCSSITDQVALNVSVYARGLLDHTELLPAWCNWTCHYGLPKWDESRELFVEPYLPHTPIGILHLTVQKLEEAVVTTTSGSRISARLRYPAGPILSPAAAPSEWDYRSPNIPEVRPDRCFPCMSVGDKRACSWAYLRRHIPHLWYVDRRMPNIGFLSRDEAHILYGTALQFKGKRALEIGCLHGWSTCHIALGGVTLDVVDPLLERADVIASVRASLDNAGVLEHVNLVGGTSPEVVDELASNRGCKWELVFVDGNHDAPHPLNDAKSCAQHAADDALILFHDLAAPDVCQGLDYLRDNGWNTVIYQTMQIMGAAWRGNVRPVDHVPDPRIQWELPRHLRGYRISGMS